MYSIHPIDDKCHPELSACDNVLSPRPGLISPTPFVPTYLWQHVEKAASGAAKPRIGRRRLLSRLVTSIRICKYIRLLFFYYARILSWGGEAAPHQFGYRVFIVRLLFIVCVCVCNKRHQRFHYAICCVVKSFYFFFLILERVENRNFLFLLLSVECVSFCSQKSRLFSFSSVEIGTSAVHFCFLGSLSVQRLMTYICMMCYIF